MTVKMYTKRPIPVPGIEWTGNNLFEVTEFIEGKRPDNRCDAWSTYEHLVADEGLKIKTLEGVMSASVGDFILRGVQGECYPCKPDIFALTYEPAQSVAADVMQVPRDAELLLMLEKVVDELDCCNTAMRDNIDDDMAEPEEETERCDYADELIDKARALLATRQADGGAKP